jgi:hypothetical protein
MVRAMRTLLLIAALVAGCAGSSAEGPQNQASTTPAAAPAAAPATAPADAPQAACPPSILDAGSRNGGACLDASVLGDAAVDACGQQLEQAGWQADAETAKIISERAGKPLRCWRAPAPQ